MEQEKQDIEFKETWRDEHLTTVCAFANANGGKLYLGVNDKKEIMGIENPQYLLESLPSKIRDALGIVVDVNILIKGGKHYIEVIVPAYPVAISCRGSYYYRSGSTTQRLTGVELESFILRKRGATWDNMPHPRLTFDELDYHAIQTFKNLAKRKQRIDPKVLEDNLEILLNKLHLINHGYLTNAALLLFTKDPEKYFSGAFIKVGYFENNADLIYQDEIHGSLFEQVDKAIELIYFKYMKAKISYVGLQRVEKYFVTEECMREAILNAVVHKQYESGVPIQISVYENKLYIGNIGKLPQNWTIEHLYSKHNSTPYNPLIAHVFYLAGQIESWGRGVEKMCASCKANNLPLPIYHVNPTDIMIQFNAPNNLVINPQNKPINYLDQLFTNTVGITVNPEEVTVNDERFPSGVTVNPEEVTVNDEKFPLGVTVNPEEVTVNDERFPLGVTVNPEEVTVNDEKFPLGVTVNPEEVTVNDERFPSEVTVNPEEVTVNDERFPLGVTDSTKKSNLDLSKLTEKETTIIQALINKPTASYTALSKEIGISRKTIAKRINILKEKQLIQRIGSDKKGYWQINEDLLTMINSQM